jgi:hypothetical protein
MGIATVRDVAIIVLAVESIVIGLLLALLLWQMHSLTRLLQDEVKPILHDARETVGTVKGTTRLVSETLVTPAVRISSFVSGVRRTAELVLGLGTRSKNG